MQEVQKPGFLVAFLGTFGTMAKSTSSPQGRKLFKKRRYPMSYDGKIMRQALARFEEDKQRLPHDLSVV